MSMVTALRAPRRSKATGTGVRRHLEVVEAPRARRLHGFSLFLGVSVVGAVLLAAVVFQVSLVTGQQHIGELEKQAQVAQQTYDRLRVEVDELSAPRRIVTRARSLGMVEVGERTWLAPVGPGVGHDANADPTTMRDYLDVKPFLGENH